MIAYPYTHGSSFGLLICTWFQFWSYTCNIICALIQPISMHEPLVPCLCCYCFDVWSDHSLFFFSFCYCFVHIYDQPISLHEHFIFCLLYLCDIRGIWSAPYPYVNALLLIDMATVNPSEFVSRLPIVSTICVLLCHDQYACGYLFSYSISCRLYI